jgi:hypothetical protein
MRMQRLAMVLTVMNLLLLVFSLSRAGSAMATTKVLPVLRGRALEIIDDSGRIRAQILVVPPTTMPDGHKYQETALFRLIDPNGRPGMKIGTGADGSGISLAGDSKRRDWSGVQILADSTGSVVKLTNRDGRVQLIKP